MKEVLQQLKALQKIDTQLYYLEELKGDLPVQVNNLKKEKEDFALTRQEQEEQLQSYKKERDMLNLEVKDLEDKKEKYKNQLYEVKTNREYDAVSAEIESVSDQVSNKETRVLELMSLEEDLETTIKETQEKAGELMVQLEQKEKDLGGRLANTESEEKKLQADRDVIAKKLTPRMLSSYERILKAKNGMAVAPVVKGALCGGCFKNLPPQRVLEIRQMNRMILCEVCGRMLIWDNSEPDSGSDA